MCTDRESCPKRGREWYTRSGINLALAFDVCFAPERLMMASLLDSVYSTPRKILKSDTKRTLKATGEQMNSQTGLGTGIGL